MKKINPFGAQSLGMIAMVFSLSPVFAQTKKLSDYKIYAGSTHAHTSYTASHGSQLERTPGATKYMEIDSNGVGRAINSQLKKDWQKFQGPPSRHFEIAKANGYDFYTTADHSQEAGYHPTSPKNPQWIAAHDQAKAATDKNFVALTAHEHSENNGPGEARGHINVINSASYLNALEKNVDIPAAYKWLGTVGSYNNEGPVVATFNHPDAKEYNSFAYRDEKVTEVITMLEMINSSRRIHFDGFIAALNAGWKVSPVAGNDNHGTEPITVHQARTFVLAESKTKIDILNAMKNRRTYAALDKNIQCRYSVNGQIMGSTLKPASEYQFDIQISDPDTGNPANRITKIEILKDNGLVAESHSPSPAHAVNWRPLIKDNTSKYFFIRVYQAAPAPGAKEEAPAEGDESEGKPEVKPKPKPNAKPETDKAVAWLAPVWTGK